LHDDQTRTGAKIETINQGLTRNVASLGFDLKDLVAHKKIVLDFVYVERSEIEESGEYDLEGLFIRLGAAIDAIGAKRVVLDTSESLFSGLSNPAMLRAEFAVQEVVSLKIIGQETAEEAQLAQGRADMGVSREVDAKPNKRKGVPK